MVKAHLLNICHTVLLDRRDCPHFSEISLNKMTCFTYDGGAYYICQAMEHCGDSIEEGFRRIVALLGRYFTSVMVTTLSMVGLLL